MAYDIDDLPPKLAAMLLAIPWTGCWLAHGGRLNRNGYTRIWWEGFEPVLHRVVYELLVGPIPPGLILDHLCTVRLCCNPAHLEPVTVQVNTLRGNAVLYKALSRIDLSPTAQKIVLGPLLEEDQ